MGVTLIVVLIKNQAMHSYLIVAAAWFSISIQRLIIQLWGGGTLAYTLTITMTLIIIITLRATMTITIRVTMTMPMTFTMILALTLSQSLRNTGIKDQKYDS